MPDPFIVGPTGLPLYRYEDWRAIVVQRWKTAYGDDADTRPETPDGLMVDTLTLFMSLLGDGVQSTYASSFFRTAEAPALDLILDMFGRQRLDALPTQVPGLWYGTAGTLVHNGIGTGPVASVVSTGGSNGDRYAVNEGESGTGTIPAVTDDGAVVVITLLAVTDTNRYSIDIDAVEQSTITNAGPADTVSTIATTWAANIVIDEPTWSATFVGLDPLGQGLIVIQGKGTEDITAGASATNPAEFVITPGIILAMSAEETGPQTVIAVTLVTIETPAAGLDGVVNLVDGQLGRDLETNEEYRRRHLDQINVGGKSTPQRIRAALLAPVVDGGLGEGAEFVRVIENETAVPLPSGQPAHSFRVIFVGTAADSEVAAIIFDQKPAGIQAWGSINEIVFDELEEPHNIGFDRGTELYLHLDIEVQDGEGYPTSGDPLAEIQAAVAADLQARLELGTDLLRFSLGAPINTVPGIVAASIETDDTPAPLDPPVFTAADIIVDETEILIADSSRITVTLAP